MAEEEFIVAIRDSSVRDIWKEAEGEKREGGKWTKRGVSRMAGL